MFTGVCEMWLFLLIFRDSRLALSKHSVPEWCWLAVSDCETYSWYWTFEILFLGRSYWLKWPGNSLNLTISVQWLPHQHIVPQLFWFEPKFSKEVRTWLLECQLSGIDTDQITWTLLKWLLQPANLFMLTSTPSKATTMKSRKRKRTLCNQTCLCSLPMDLPSAWSQWTWWVNDGCDCWCLNFEITFSL